MSSSSRRTIGVLVLAAALLAPWAAAAEPGGRNDPGTRTPWDFFAQFWSAVAILWGDAGCHMDPYGACGKGSVPPAPTESVDAGCSVDPFGGCRNGS
jgi:hypothetical protein